MCGVDFLSGGVAQSRRRCIPFVWLIIDGDGKIHPAKPFCEYHAPDAFSHGIPGVAGLKDDTSPGRAFLS